MKLRKQLINDTPYKFGNANGRKFITVHETGNTRAGADAAAHANLQTGGNHAAQATWHYQVDDREAVQSYTHDFQLWHAGDGYGNGNLHSIGIETCVNADGDFAATRRNLVALIVQIAKTEKLSVSAVVQHNHWSGKNCPERMRANGGELWNSLIAQVRAALDGGQATKPPAKPNSKPMSVEEAARQIVYGVNGRNPWGNGQARRDALARAGLNPDTVQYRVNQLMGAGGGVKNSVDAVAREIVYGVNGVNPWGNGHDRFRKLRVAGYDADEVQRRVNQLVGY